MDAVKPKLLRIPQKFNNSEEVLGVASKLNLSNILVLSETKDGDIVFLDTDFTAAEANWLLDRVKVLLLMPGMHQEVNQND